MSEETVFFEEFKAYMAENGGQLLAILEDYLRKELKLPKYSKMFDYTELFVSETQQLFSDNPQLIEKLEKLQAIIKNVNRLLS